MTDGSPNLPEWDGREEVAVLGDAGATVFTLNIGAVDGFRDLLQDLSGSPGSRHERRFALEAAGAEELSPALQEVATHLLDGAGPAGAVRPDGLFGINWEACQPVLAQEAGLFVRWSE